MTEDKGNDVTRREFVRAASGALLAIGSGSLPAAGADNKAKDAVLAQIPKMHAANVKRLQDWIALPSIAAEDLNYPKGAQYFADMAMAAGFTNVRIIPTAGKQGVFGKIDSGARSTLAVYCMYDVKQYDPAEWSSPPLEARLVRKEGLGTVCMGRGAINTKGPQNTFLSALLAFKAAGKKLPVNLVLVGEGEEEIGSPNFGQIVEDPEVFALLKKCLGIMLPDGAQGSDGSISFALGGKGVVELELISSGEKWGRGPVTDIHSRHAAHVDSPSWHLIQALNTLIGKDGNTPAVEGFFEHVKPLTEAQRKLVRDYAAATPEDLKKKELFVQRWIEDLSWEESLMRLYSQPTINIEGLVGGYTGPGGKTILPNRAVAKIDMRLVPDMTAADSVAKVKAHLAKHGFADIEVNMSGGYDPTQSDPNSAMIKAFLATYRKLGRSPVVLPRSPGSWPGYRFTNPPLSLSAGAFGLGHGGGAHAPDEYYVIESTNPKIAGLDDAVASMVECLYALA